MGSNYDSRYRDPNRDRDRNRRESKEFDPDPDSDTDPDPDDSIDLIIRIAGFTSTSLAKDHAAVVSS
jgi:hypothetical protein